MPRVRKGAARTKARRRLLKAARGYRGTRSKHKQQAKITLTRAGQFAYRDRRARRRDFRRLWITRLSAACRMRDTRYSRFIHGLQQAGILLNRKMLSQLAIEDPKLFDQLVQIAEAKLAAASTSAPARKTRSKPKPKAKAEAEPEPKPKAKPQPQPDAARST
ncbi:MAG: 50S ribosomal protein L20 [Phycisphaerales bacterium]